MYDNKLKRMSKELQLENSDLRIKLHDLTQLFIKHDLLPSIAIMECECKTKPRCVACEARDILKEAGFNITVKEKEKSLIVLPGDMG
jgi:hypothetical protein